MPSVASQGSGGTKSRLVLVVDDNPGDRYLLVHDLEKHGYRTISAGTGEQALSFAASDHPDLIILDVGLPGMDGWETLAKLKQSAATGKIPVVMLTGHQESDDLIRGYSSGVTYFIPKPYVQEELLRGLEIAFSASVGPDVRGP